MAKKKQEDPPKGSPAWMATFSDLMNLLLCFFVLLFSMASVDAAKFDLVVNSLKSAFSILQAGGSSITADGNLIGSGISQMPDYSNYFGDTLNDTEGRETEDGANTTVVEGGGAADQTEMQQMTEQEQVDQAETVQNAQENDRNENQDQAQNAGQTADQNMGQNADQNANQMSGEQTGQEAQQNDISTSEAQKALDKKALAESEMMAEQIEKLTTMYGLQKDVEIDYNGQYVRLTLNGALLFDSGSADVKTTAYKIVDNIGLVLNAYKDSLIEVEGHTDNIPIRSAKFESNDVLSMYRALSVAERLRNASDLAPGNIISSGRGAYVPIADNASPEGRARNRRVEIKIFNSFNSGSIQNGNA